MKRSISTTLIFLTVQIALICLTVITWNSVPDWTTGLFMLVTMLWFLGCAVAVAIQNRKQHLVPNSAPLEVSANKQSSTVSRHVRQANSEYAPGFLNPDDDLKLMKQIAQLGRPQ
jgi:hypothetical protein